jgi:hypothetical protein
MRAYQSLFVTSVFAGFLIAAAPAGAAEAPSVEANRAVEITFTARREYADPFNELNLDVLFTDPAGRERRVPAFWAGGRTWRVRYASPALGMHRYRSVCTPAGDAGLDGVQGTVEVTPYHGDNPLFRHGALRVAADHRHLEHADGTPFFWLGDSWWMGLSERLHWPDEFRTLTADRRAKGFNVVQIVAGLYPDMPAFDERGRNEAGFPWEKDYTRINPAYFDAADRRLAHLVESGLMPCLTGAWGYHLPWLGVERMKKHWRYLVARYGAWPVVWCLAGEGAMPYYLSKSKKDDAAFQRHGWTEVARYLRQIDPYSRLLTVHPTATSRDQLDDAALLDFDMLQTGHNDWGCLPNTFRLIRASRAAQPVLPVVVGEVCYEGIGGKGREDLERFLAWSCLLSGTAGHTYGANGIWQVNRREQRYGKSPHGGDWGGTPWDNAMRLPGGRQVGLAKRLLEQYPWWRFEPHPDWVAFANPQADRHTPQVPEKSREFIVPYAAGSAAGVRIIYVPTPDAVIVRALDAGKRYTAHHVDTVTGESTQPAPAQANNRGEWLAAPLAGAAHDWVLVLEPQ